MGKNEVALILAGGRGKRMDILCDRRPKPALPFAGRFRVIDFSTSNCMHSGISDIGVLVDYQREHLAEYLESWRSNNGNKTGLRILPPDTGSYAGTADAVYQNLDFLKNSDAALVLAGDHIYKMDYRKMLDFHRKMKAHVTVGVVRVPLAETHRFGTVTVDGPGRITEFREKSSLAQSNLASMGIYIFDTDRLAARLQEDAGEPGSLHDFGYNILPRMVKTDKAFAYEFKGIWRDIGTVKAYYEANMELLAPRPRFSLDGSWPILGDTDITPSFRIGREGAIVNSLISPGCVIDGRVENSVLSPGVRIAEQSVVRNSLIMADTSIGYHSIIDGCILDEAVNIGNFCYVGFGAGLVPYNEQITILGKEVAVPDRTAIGRQCIVRAGTGPAAFDTRLIPSGTTLVLS